MNSSRQDGIAKRRGVPLMVLLLLTASCEAFQPQRTRNLPSSQSVARSRNVNPLVERTSRVKGSWGLHALVPEENPYANPETRSVSGVRYGSVLSGMDTLFPPKDLDRRNALSRTDGYWPFIQDGTDPPQQFTYGEFDFYFFAQLLDRVHELYFSQDGKTPQQDWRDMTFVDIGSGTGRLVLAAAALHPTWRKCRGIELLKGIHNNAEENLESCRNEEGHALTATYATVDSVESLPLAPVQFTCGSFEDPYVYFADADCVFVFSSCMSQGLMGSLSSSIGRQCKPGTIVITTEFPLLLEGTVDPVEQDPRLPSGAYKLELMEQVEGWCWLTGGESTAYVHKVVESLWREGVGELEEPKVTPEEMAYKVVQDLESGELTDTESFMRGVSNNMAFLDLPEAWQQSLDDEE